MKVLTNSIRSFQNSCGLETGFSDFRKMTVTVLKSYLEKKQPKIIFYRDFGKFSNNDFRTQILRDFATPHLSMPRKRKTILWPIAVLL